VARDAAVAAGNADTAEAAVAVLRAGGNAVDAAVAAGMAAAVAEPGLSSLGGGGFLLAVPPGEPATVFDFFVDAPGRGRPAARLEPAFLPVVLRFAGAEQVFHAGWGSVAVPGCLDGYLHVHRRLGRLPLADVVAPARRLAAEGTVVDAAQGALLRLLAQILTLTAEGRAVFAPHGSVLRPGERMRNEALASFLDEVAAGRVTGFATPSLAGPLELAVSAGGGLLTAADLAAYAVVERTPLEASYRGARLLTNPPPSFGGTLVVQALARLERGGPLDGSAAGTLRLAQALVKMSERHVAGPRSSRGTTHVSVVDADGGVASMTTSNGSCSGHFAPGTGIQLNNVMGEADLHPEGFTATAPGVRIGSMMSPTVVTSPDGGMVVLGSGGSERIRSALSCVLVGLLDGGRSLGEAVRAPRLHWDRSVLQVEPGVPEPALAELRRRWPVHRWAARDLYFGGAHGVARAADGTVSAAGDDRRGGVGRVVALA
jgi:gamma-glutamyltranspeptidase / glutathione hydrolase